MGLYRDLITDFTPGTAKRLRYIISNVPSGFTTSRVIFVCKDREDDDDADALFSFELTLVETADGKIEQDGSNGEIAIRVDLTASRTDAIGMEERMFFMSLDMDAGPTPWIPVVGRFKASAQSTVS